MNSIEIPALYRKYFVDKNDERRMLFEKVKEAYAPDKGIYSASFVHITRSFPDPATTAMVIIRWLP